MKQPRFDDVLNECLETVLTGSRTVEQCLQAHPAFAAELEPLLRTAVAVESAVTITPAPEAKQRVRYRLQLKIAQVRKPRGGFIFQWQPAWATATLAVLLVFVLGGSTVLAADSSMPGSPLYPVKIASEDIRIQMTSSPAEKAELYATLADRRVAELGYVAKKGNTQPAVVEKIADRYSEYVKRMSELPLAGEAAPMLAATGVSPALAPSIAGTETPEKSAETARPGTMATPPTASSKGHENETGEKSQKTAASARQSAAQTTTSPTSSLSDKEREDVLGYVKHNSTAHPQELEKYLDQLPEQSKPAIRRMIQDAKQLYPEVQDKLESGRDKNK